MYRAGNYGLAITICFLAQASFNAILDKIFDPELLAEIVLAPCLI